jgi:hypothetical protein
MARPELNTMKPDPTSPVTVSTDSTDSTPATQHLGSRAGRLLLPLIILVLPVAALLWMAVGRSPKPIQALSAGEVTRRSTPDQAVQYALPNAAYPITALPLADGRVLRAQSNLPLDRDQIGMYIFTMLTELVGREAQQRYLPLEDFARRLARSAADLPRNYLPWAFWPVRPTEGRFLTHQQDGKIYIAQANASRYDGLVQLLTGLDDQALVAAYVRAYPLFQKAYASLGHNYAGYYLNDSVISAIDDLLKTPEPNADIELLAAPDQGATPSQARPWLAWRYANPEYEQLPVGQKTLLRMGAAHRAAIKAKLQGLRELLSHGRPTTE